MFKRDGYQIFRNVIPEAVVAATRDFLTREVDKTTALMAEHGFASGDGSVDSLIELSRRIKTLPGDVAKAVTGHFPLDVRLSPHLRPLMTAAPLLHVVRECLGSEPLYLHLPPTARFVLSGNGLAGVPRHRDVAYNMHMSHFVTAWTPLTDVDEACGGVAVYEGSQRSDRSEDLVDLRGDMWLEPVSVGACRRRPCVPMMPGDVLVLNKLIIHESMANMSDRTRLSVDMRFFGAGDTSSKHYLDLQTAAVVLPA